MTRVLSDKLMALEFGPVIQWLESPAGEYWSARNHSPLLDLWMTVVVDPKPRLVQLSRGMWTGAWRCRPRGVVHVWFEPYDIITTPREFTPDLGPEYCEYPQVSRSRECE